MGLEKKYRDKSPPEVGLQVVNSSGKRWAFFPANESGDGVQSFTTDYEIMRGDFCKIMYEATKHRASYIFGNSTSKIEQHEKSVDGHFQKGSSQTFDIVIGADGVNSRTDLEDDGSGWICSMSGAAYRLIHSSPTCARNGREYGHFLRGD